MSDTGFVHGMELSRGFFTDLVNPILSANYPDLPYSAALIGSGSEVLGFDTPMSTDHHWGPRVMLFLRAEDYEALHGKISDHLARELPSQYRGYSTNFSAPNPDDNGTQLLEPSKNDLINHRVEMYTIDGFYRSYMNISIHGTMSSADWLSLPTQKFRSVVSGEIYHDDLLLRETKERLSWYPRDVWLYIIGSLWTRIGQEEHLMGRAGYVGDESGSALIGARIVRDIMRIAFLLERQYPPYPKWFGTAFGRLTCAPSLDAYIGSALHARTWQERQSALSSAYEALLRVQRASELNVDTHEQVSAFWGRPFVVIHGDVIAEAIFSQIDDTHLRRLAEDRTIGSIDLISDNTDLLENASLRPLIRRLFEN